MSDTTATAALITGIFAISLFCLKYIVNCVCPGKCSGDLLVNACCKKPKQINPLIKLTSCWEERRIKKNDIELLDQSSPRGYHNNHNGYYAKRDLEENNWIVTLTNKDIQEKVSVYLYFPFEENILKSYKHFFRCKIKYIPNKKGEQPESFIRIKKFRTTKRCDLDKNGNYIVDQNNIPKFIYNNHSPPIVQDVVTDIPILFDNTISFM